MTIFSIIGAIFGGLAAIFLIILIFGLGKAGCKYDESAERRITGVSYHG